MCILSFFLLMLAIQANAQSYIPNYGYNTIFENKANVRAKPSLNGAIIGTLQCNQTLERCDGQKAYKDTINGRIDYWRPIVYNDTLAFVWGGVFCTSRFKSMLNVDDLFLVGFSTDNVLGIKVLHKDVLTYESSFSRKEKKGVQLVLSLGKTFNSKGKEIIAVKYFDQSYELFEWDFKTITKSNITLTDDSYLTGKYIDFEYSLIAKNNVNLRKQPHIDADVIKILSVHAKVKVIRAHHTYDKEKRGNWHQLLVGNDTGYVFNTLVSISKRYIKSNKFKGIAFLHTSNGIYVYQNNKLIYEQKKRASYDAHYLYEKGCMGLDTAYQFLAVEIVGEACGKASGEELYYWDGTTLKYAGFDYGIGDAGYSQQYALIFPNEFGGRKNRVISINENGESIDFPQESSCDPPYSYLPFNVKYKILKFDGDTFLEMTSKYSRLRQSVKDDFPKHHIKHACFGNVNSDGLEDALVYLSIDEYEFTEGGATKPIIAVYTGSKNRNYKLQTHNQSLIKEKAMAVMFAITEGEFSVKVVYNSGLWADENATPFVEEYIFTYFKADQKYLWSSITEYEGIRNASYRYDWKSSTSYFKKNKLYFEQAWSSK